MSLELKHLILSILLHFFGTLPCGQAPNPIAKCAEEALRHLSGSHQGCHNCAVLACCCCQRCCPKAIARLSVVNVKHSASSIAPPPRTPVFGRRGNPASLANSPRSDFFFLSLLFLFFCLTTLCSGLCRCNIGVRHF